MTPKRLRDINQLGKRIIDNELTAITHRRGTRLR
jgi:hypothetical protein